KSKDVRQDVERAKQTGAPISPYRTDRSRISGPLKSDLAPIARFARSDADGLDGLVAAVRARYRGRCPVLSVMNLKGGVGKTTVSAQLSGMLQTGRTKRVLLVDFDPQYNLTQTFFPMEQADASAAIDRSVISLFERSRLHAQDAPSPADDWSTISLAPFAPAPRDNFMHDLLGVDGPDGRLDLITGQFEISKYAFSTDADALKAVKRNFISTIDHYRGAYDLIIFDTNPNATFLTQCALEASDRVLAPMHADVYSLRGVKLLNRVIHDQVSEDNRPRLSVMFNAVNRNEQSDFEADARNADFDDKVGFTLSRALMGAALPRSGHMQIRPPTEEEPAWRRLLAHHGRGGGLRAMRESLAAAATELQGLMDETV
ncbi:MAG: ParA family protein, partial [Pseudomonadota bacterium]